MFQDCSPFYMYSKLKMIWGRNLQHSLISSSKQQVDYKDLTWLGVARHFLFFCAATGKTTFAIFDHKCAHLCLQPRINGSCRGGVRANSFRTFYATNWKSSISGNLSLQFSSQVQWQLPNHWINALTGLAILILTEKEKKRKMKLNF